MKKTAIALAVAAIAAAPLAAQADAGAYASVRVATTQTDDGTDAKWDITDHSSRFGFKGSEDLGNGMKAFGRWEFRVKADSASIKDGNGLGYAGISGDFGSVSLGRQWTPFYLLMASVTDQFNAVGLNQASTTARVSDVLAYQNKFGGTTFALAAVMDGSDDDMFQRVQVGASIPAGPVTVGVALDNKTEDNGVAGTDGSRTGVSVAWEGGDVTVAGSLIISTDDLRDEDLRNGDDDEIDTSVYVGYNLGGGQKIHGSFESSDFGGDATPTTIALGYQKKLSKSSRVWAEFQNEDPDTSADATTKLSFGVRKDW